MSGNAVAQTVADADYADDFGDDDACWTCGGEGWEWCEDWDCWEPDCDGDGHTCPNCHGSGLASDVTYW